MFTLIIMPKHAKYKQTKSLLRFATGFESIYKQIFG